jgi:hypothetical protein
LYDALDPALAKHLTSPQSENANRLKKVLLGDVYLNRYKVITKLGYGSNSTVWLSLDQK